jgi:hypothetical protein
MTSRGLLTCSVALACLLAATPAFAQGGGAVAPATPVPQADAAVAEPEGPPPPVAAQEPPPPDGEEQPDGAPDGLPEDGAPNGETIAQGESGAALPRTGMEVLALAMIGLGLLLAGGALWPTSSWPPPRDRLSRSTLPR